MQCRGTTIGIYEGATDEWIEYDTATGKLTRWKLPKRNHPWVEYDAQGKEVPDSGEATFVTGIAMLDSGDVYASFRQHPENRIWNKAVEVGLYRLQKDGTQGRWIPVVGTIGKLWAQGGFEKLCGTDGKRLVYSRFGERNWSFSPPPQ